VEVEYKKAAGIQLVFRCYRALERARGRYLEGEVNINRER